MGPAVFNDIVAAAAHDLVSKSHPSPTPPLTA